MYFVCPAPLWLVATNNGSSLALLPPISLTALQSGNFRPAYLGVMTAYPWPSCIPVLKHQQTARMECARAGCKTHFHPDDQWHSICHAPYAEEIQPDHPKVCSPYRHNELLKKHGSTYVKLNSKYRRAASWKGPSLAHMLSFTQTRPPLASLCSHTMLKEVQDVPAQTFHGFTSKVTNFSESPQPTTPDCQATTAHHQSSCLAAWLSLASNLMSARVP